MPKYLYNLFLEFLLNHSKMKSLRFMGNNCSKYVIPELSVPQLVDWLLPFMVISWVIIAKAGQLYWTADQFQATDYYVKCPQHLCTPATMSQD